MEKFKKEPMEGLLQHRWVIVGVIAVITVFFASQLPRAHMDNNLSGVLPEDMPVRIIARHFEKEYGEEIAVLVGPERPYGTIFDSAFLSRIRKFSETVENIELVKDTNSIMSTQYITSDSESIIVTGLVGKEFSGTEEEIAELKRRLDSWETYQGTLVSEDLSSTQIVVTLNATIDE